MANMEKKFAAVRSGPKKLGTACAEEDSPEMFSNEQDIVINTIKTDEGVEGTSFCQNGDERSAHHTNKFPDAEFMKELILICLNRNFEGIACAFSNISATRQLEKQHAMVPYDNTQSLSEYAEHHIDALLKTITCSDGHAAFQCRLKGSESLVICLWLPQHTMSTAIMIEVSLKDLGIYTISGQKILFPDIDGTIIEGKGHITTTGGLLELENTSNSSIDGKCMNKCRPTGCKAATRADGCRCDRHQPGCLQDSTARHTHSREELGYIRRASFTSIAQGRFKKPEPVEDLSEFHGISDDSHLRDKSGVKRTLEQFGRVKEYQNDKMNSNSELNRELCHPSCGETGTVWQLSSQIDKFGCYIVAVPCEDKFADLPAADMMQAEAEPELTVGRSKPFDAENEKLCDFRLLEESPETNKADETCVKDFTDELEKVSSYQKGQPSPLSKEGGMEAVSNGNHAPGNRGLSKHERGDVCNDPVQPTCSQQLQDKAGSSEVTENKSYLDDDIPPPPPDSEPPAYEEEPPREPTPEPEPEREPVAVSIQAPSHDYHPRQCCIKKWPDFQGYGFNLHAEKEKTGQYIGAVDYNSPADEAHLKQGDRIVEVNGVNIEDESHTQVIQRIKAGGEQTTLLVVDPETDDFYKNNGLRIHSGLDEVLKYETSEREVKDDDIPPPPPDSEPPAYEEEPPREPTPEPEPEREPVAVSIQAPSHDYHPRQCCIKKWPDFQGYGFNLHAEKEKTGQYIGAVDYNSPADEAHLKQGDRIVEVNGVNIEDESHTQVIQRIKAGGEQTTLLVVDPETDDFYKNNGLRIHSGLDEVLKYETSEREVKDDDIPPPPPDSEPPAYEEEPPREPTPEPEPEREPVAVSIQAPSHDYHPRQCCIKKWPDFQGYGFNLHAEKEKTGQYIGAVDYNSPADEAHLKQGDRIVEVNGVNIEDESHTQVIQRIKAGGEQTTLLVVDPETDDFYKNNGLRIHSGLDEVLKYETSEREVKDDDIPPPPPDSEPPAYEEEPPREPTPEPEPEREPVAVSIQAPSHDYHPRQCCIKKWPDFQGYGFNLHAEKEKTGQYIGAVDYNSPADEAHLKQGDRIVEVNGVNIEDESHTQVIQRIKAGGEQTTLLVVDPETDDFYKNNGLRIHSGLDEVLKYETSEREVKDCRDPSSTSVDSEAEDVGAERSQEKDTVCEQKIIDNANDDPNDPEQYKAKEENKNSKSFYPDYEKLKDFRVNKRTSGNRTKQSTYERLLKLLASFFANEKLHTLFWYVLHMLMLFGLIFDKSSENVHSADNGEGLLNYKYCLKNVIELSVSRQIVLYPVTVVRYSSYAGDLINYVTGYHGAELDLPEPALPQFPLGPVVQQLPAPDLPYTAGQSNGTDVDMAAQVVEQPRAAQQLRDDLPLPAEESGDNQDAGAEEGDNLGDVQAGSNNHIAAQAAQQPRDGLPLPAEEAGDNQDAGAEVGDNLGDVQAGSNHIAAQAAQQPRDDFPLLAEEASGIENVRAEVGDDWIDLHAINNINIAVQSAQQPRDNLPLPTDEASDNDVWAEEGDDLSEGSLHTLEEGRGSHCLWSDDDDEETLNLTLERQNDDNTDEVTQQKLLQRSGTMRKTTHEKHGCQETCPSEAGTVVRHQMVSLDNRITQVPEPERGEYTGWPEDKPPVEQMVKAGFNYTGHSDRVRCPAFGCTLQEFLVNDDPLEEHALHHPYCPFVRRTFGEAAINEILSRRGAPVETYIYRRFLTSEAMAPFLSRLPRTGNYLVMVREAINNIYQTQGVGVQPTEEALVRILAYVRGEIDRQLEAEAEGQGATGYTPPGNQQPEDC